MVVRIKLTLDQDEFSALMKSALADLRNPSDQARFFLRRELERRGLLTLQNEPAQLQATVVEPKTTGQ